MIITLSDSENRPQLPRGTLARIARRLKNKRTKKPLSHAHVREVYLGLRKSPRIERAIQREAAKYAAKTQETGESVADDTKDAA